MANRLPASMRTRQNLSDLIEGRLSSPDGRSELVKLAARLIIEEALEDESRDALGRDYYERDGDPDRGCRNGVSEGRLKTAEGMIPFSAPQIADGKEPFRSEIRRITMRGCGDPAPRGEIKDEVLSHPGRYAEIATNLRAKEVVLGGGERRRRYILCLNQEESERQMWRRAALLETLEAELDALKDDHPKRACRLLSSKRFGPYLGQDESGRPLIDRDKVKRAEHLDGKSVLTTNDDTLSVADIALGYKGMWIIESCFRRMKTTGLEVRPMFHWMPQRITAHVKRCVLALMIQRAAERATAMTWRQIHDLLTPIKAVRYTAEGRTFVQASRIGPEARGVLKELDISTPKTLLDVA